MSSSESKFQWIAISLTAIGLFSSTYYNSHILKSSRIENELSSYLKLNEQYNKLLFKLINNDSESFKKTDDISLNKNKYVMYELIELFATIKSLEAYHQEIGTDVSGIWNQRLEFLFSKPAIQYAWQLRRKYAEKIYSPTFVKLVEQIIAQNKKTAYSKLSIAPLQDVHQN